jgi:transcriptional regulator with XRE-family HTH domain
MTTMTERPTAPPARAGVHPDEVRRGELAAFLRSRRERISPDQVGLPAGGRRRTPGLRREEVAQVAGVGVTWYTWLEQGRDIRVSDQVLDAVSRTLLLDPHERSHLFTLAGSPLAEMGTDSTVVTPEIDALLAKLHPFPACVTNSRYDLLAFNGAYLGLIGDIEALPFDQRNSLWLIFTSPTMRRALLDQDEAWRRMVGQYRAAMAEHVAEPAWKCLVRRLHEASPEFAALWRRHDVAAPENLTKRFLHPDLGELRFTYVNLWLSQRPGARLVSYTPADEATAALLPALGELRPRPLFP